jgi:hypothetical protein
MQPIGADTPMAASHGIPTPFPWKCGGDMNHAIRAILLAAIFSAFLSGSADAQRVPGTLTGCVIGGVFYSVHMGVQAHRTRLPASIELFPLEGRTVRMDGWIMRANYFEPTSPPKVLQATCAAHLVPAIRHDLVVEQRVKGQQAARRRAYDEAYRLFGLAVMLDPADCDTYVDRAFVHALRGDESAALADLEVLEKRDCRDPDKANHLLLEDVAKVFEKRGRSDRALAIYRMALAVCENRDTAEICREATAENIRRVSRPKPDKTR